MALDDLTHLVAARTGLAVPRDAVRNTVDALCCAGILQRHPGVRYTPTAYAVVCPSDLAGQLATFCARYRPRWEPFPNQLPPEAALLLAYEERYRQLPDRPDLLELALKVRLLGCPWLASRLQRLGTNRTKCEVTLSSRRRV